MFSLNEFIFELINGEMSSFSGNAMWVEIFLCNFKECSKRFNNNQNMQKYSLTMFQKHFTFKWKQATTGSFLKVNCLVESCILPQNEQLKLLRVSGCVNLKI